MAATPDPHWTTGPPLKIKREFFKKGNKCFMHIIQLGVEGVPERLWSTAVRTELPRSVCRRVVRVVQPTRRPPLWAVCRACPMAIRAVQGTSAGTIGSYLYPPPPNL